MLRRFFVSGSGRKPVSLSATQKNGVILKSSGVCTITALRPRKTAIGGYWVKCASHSNVSTKTITGDTGVTPSNNNTQVTVL